MELEGAAATRRPFHSGPPTARSLRRARLAAIGWGIFLMALTSWPSPPTVPIVSAIPDFDKLVHTLLYGVEGFLLLRAVVWPPGSRSSWLRALAVAGAIAVWATLDEIHQYWIPGRAMEGFDALADTAGGFLGALAAAWSARST
jgi:VanZ family protein